MTKMRLMRYAISKQSIDSKTSDCSTTRTIHGSTFLQLTPPLGVSNIRPFTQSQFFQLNRQLRSSQFTTTHIC